MSVHENNAERFLAAFASIERSLNIIAKTTKYSTFSKLLGRCASLNRTVSANQEALREYAELRNAIVHQRDEELEIIAQPTDAVTEHIEKIAGLLDGRRSLINYATSPVVTVGKEADVRRAFDIMRQMETTKLPVYKDQNFQGIITMETIAAWGMEGCDEKRTCGDIMEKGRYERVLFMRNDARLDEAVLAFEEALQAGRRPPVIILNGKGTPNQRPDGIITAYDLPAILSELI